MNPSLFSYPSCLLIFDKHVIDINPSPSMTIVGIEQRMLVIY